jgi:hypothetical protein
MRRGLQAPDFEGFSIIAHRSRRNKAEKAKRNAPPSVDKVAQIPYYPSEGKRRTLMTATIHTTINTIPTIPPGDV